MSHGLSLVKLCVACSFLILKAVIILKGEWVVWHVVVVSLGHWGICCWVQMLHVGYLCLCQGCEFSVRVSYLEIYNEELIDLLGAESVDNPRLKIYEDTTRKVGVRLALDALRCSECSVPCCLYWIVYIALHWSLLIRVNQQVLDEVLYKWLWKWPWL